MNIRIVTLAACIGFTVGSASTAASAQTTSGSEIDTTSAIRQEPTATVRSTATAATTPAATRAASTSAVPRGVPAPAAIISRDVLVAAGDTLKSIARRELGRTGFAPQLAEFNGLVARAPLIPGNIIRIPIHGPARGEFAQVVYVKGVVTARRFDEQSVLLPTAGVVTAAAVAVQARDVPLQRNSEVLSGDIIRTSLDGYVSIEFSSGSVINLQPDSEAILSRLNCLPADDSCVIEIRTLRGKITSDVLVRDDQPVDFRISTPYASAAVRGTVFDVNAAEALRVAVTEGLIDLSAQGETVELPSGFGSIVEEGQAPGDPIALLPAPVFKRVPARLAPVDAVTWWPFSDAASYAAQVTNDAEGNETIASFTIEEDRVGFSDIDSGDYFLLLRATDGNGLQGFTSNTRITIADVDESIAPVQTTITRQGSEFLVTVEDPPVNAIGFEIQIAETAAFDDPLSVDVNTNGSAVFRLDTDRVYTRARVLLDPYTVSAYGDIADSDQ